MEDEELVCAFAEFFVCSAHLSGSRGTSELMLFLVSCLYYKN